MSSKNINRTFTEDHRRLRQLFQKFQSLKATDRADAKEAFKEFKVELERHIRWEERILFPCFDHKYTHLKYSPISLLHREHEQILVYLADLEGKLAKADFNTDAHERDIEMALRLHSENEEEGLFPALDKVLTDTERVAIMEAMDRCK